MSGGICYVLECVAVPIVSVICGLIVWKTALPSTVWEISVKAFIANRVIMGLCAENVGTAFDENGGPKGR